MGKFISKKWNKILVFIGICFLVLIFISKITAPKTLIPDYIKYGKDIKLVNVPEVPDSAKEALGSAKSEVVSSFKNANPGIVKLMLIIGGAVLLIVFLDSLASMFGRKKEEKKKK